MSSGQEATNYETLSLLGSSELLFPNASHLSLPELDKMVFIVENRTVLGLLEHSAAIELWHKSRVCVCMLVVLWGYHFWVC